VEYSLGDEMTNVALGVTVVQYRDKTSDTGVLVETARKLHNLCQSYGVPLLINDRVDVAVAVGAEGVHLGQDDMSWLSAIIIL
jgi:thiamine-phosphate diphosphorylase/hydroxyethylthiazole kinase